MAIIAAVLVLAIPNHHNCQSQITHTLDVRVRTNYMLDVMGMPQYPASKRRYACSVYKKHGFIHTLWAVRYHDTRLKYLHPPHYDAWMCIHSGEGSWTDPDAPYYGGLQMDWDFQHTYSPNLLAQKGTAEHWTPLEQMWTAEKAYSSGRGFYPWPTTAARCGLI